MIFAKNLHWFFPWKLSTAKMILSLFLFRYNVKWVVLNDLRGWIQSFAIFWKTESQFDSSECFRWGRENDEPRGIVNCRSCLIFFECYSPDLTLWLQYGFLEIHAFRPTSPCLIIEVLATRTKFLKPSGYWTVINCADTFWHNKCFGCFHGFMSLFNLVKYKILN